MSKWRIGTCVSWEKKSKTILCSDEMKLNFSAVLQCATFGRKKSQHIIHRTSSLTVKPDGGSITKTKIKAKYKQIPEEALF